MQFLSAQAVQTCFLALYCHVCSLYHVLVYVSQTKRAPGTAVSLHSKRKGMPLKCVKWIKSYTL